MNLHKYYCMQCDQKEFYTWFQPLTDEKPSYCPCCGSDEYVHYGKEVDIDARIPR